MHGVLTTPVELTRRTGAVAAAEAGLLDGRIFFINRDCDKDRREALERELVKASLSAERVSAANGLQVPEDLRPYFFSGNTLHGTLREGEVGCYASHLKAMQVVAARDLSFAVVLEDDAVLPPNFETAVGEVLAALPPSWDIVLLYGTPTRAVKPVATLRRQLGKLVRYSRVPSGTVAYLINQRGARKLLAPRTINWPIDTDFRRPWAFNLEIFGVLPQLVSHCAELPSAIQELGGRARRRRGIPLPKPGNWTGNPLHSPRGVLYNIDRLGPLSWLLCLVQNSIAGIGRKLGDVLQSQTLSAEVTAVKSSRPAKGAIAR